MTLTSFDVFAQTDTFEENQRLSRLVDGLERIVMVGVSKMNKFTFTKSSDQVSS